MFLFKFDMEIYVEKFNYDESISDYNEITLHDEKIKSFKLSISLHVCWKPQRREIFAEGKVCLPFLSHK